MGGLLLVLAVLVYLGLVSHPNGAPWARVLLSCIAAFIGTQVVLGKRIPGLQEGPLTRQDSREPFGTAAGSPAERAGDRHAPRAL